MAVLALRFLSLVFLLLAVGCQTSQHASSAADTLTVEGAVSMRGHGPSIGYVGEPPAEDSTLERFQDFPGMALMLETNDGAMYVLALDENDAGLREAAPGTFRVTGELYSDTWNGETYAHLRVLEWEEVGW